MIMFKVIISKSPNVIIKTEDEILKVLYENINFYDDYDCGDYYNNFIEAFNLICYEFASIKDSFFFVSGYGLEWSSCKNLVDNIFPDILDVINNLKLNISDKLIIYDANRIIYFYSSKNSNGNIISSRCTSLQNHNIGIPETIHKDKLISQLVSIVNELMLFSKQNYPYVYKNYLYPYLRLYNLGDKAI